MKLHNSTSTGMAIVGSILFSIAMYSGCWLFLLSAGKIIDISRTIDNTKLTEMGLYVCGAVVLLTIIFSKIRKSINVKRERQIFYNSRQTWRITWFFGGILSILAFIFDHHILYINWYFFAVGLIPLFNSLYRYAEVNKDGITIYYGIFFNRRNLTLPWSQIEAIGSKTITKIGRVSGGGRVWVSTTQEYEEDIFRIQLKRPLDESICKKLNNSNKFNIFVNEYHINKNRTEIVLNTQPQRGYDALEYAVSKFCPSVEQIEKPPPNALFYLFETIGAATFFIVMIMQLFLWFMLFPK